MSEYSRRTVAGVLVAVLITAFVAIELNDLYSPTTNSSASQSVGSNGLRLSVSISATQIAVGRTLQVNVSLFNTLSAVNSVTPSNDWLFHGIPLALWPDCYYTNFYHSANFTTAAEAVVLKGDYTMANISTMANVHFPSGSCHEGEIVDHAIFQPNSSHANMTGISFGLPKETNGTTSVYQVSNSFTTNGYWDLLNNSQRVPPPFLGFSYQQLPLSPTATAFVPGEYTVAVADEWGDAVILHFVVRA